MVAWGKENGLLDISGRKRIYNKNKNKQTNKHIAKFHNIIQIHNSVLWNYKYSKEYSYSQYEYEQYFVEYY